MAVLVGLALVYVGGGAITARAFGWHALATRYPDQPMVVERTLRGTVSVGTGYVLVSKHAWARLDVGDRGIRLTASPLGRFAHPPILIPWRAIERCEAAPAAWARVRLRAVGVDRDLAVFLRNAVVLLRGCRDHQVGAPQGTA